MVRTQLSIGCTVDIKRSDGRTHSAIVCFIDHDAKLVKVEWFENNDTRGKEIHFSEIFAINPTIFIGPKASSFDNQPPKAKSMIDERTSSKIPKKKSSSAKRIVQKTMIEETPPPPPPVPVPLPPPAPVEVVTSPDSLGITLDSKKTKRITKLERARMDRRKKNAEMKAAKAQLFRYNQNNPHWQLIVMISEYRKSISIKPLSAIDAIEDHLITVAVRKRPLNKSDVAKKEVDILTVPSKNQLLVHEPKHKVDLTRYLENHLFRFDYTFNETCDNETVYKRTAQPLLETIFQGGFATCFAYGQTGSGKTFTMSGNSDEQGIYALTTSDIFKMVGSAKYRQFRFIVSCSFFEIYTKKVFDLLNHKGELKILEDGKQQVQIVGLTEKVVRNVSDVLRLIEIGNEERASGQTSANLNSSRSHAIFQIYIRSADNLKCLHGKFSLIDLAGNERGADTFLASKLTRLEGAEINQSLLALKECIRALGRKDAHLPFRASKLTQVLKDSFVGTNSKTCMIAMVSPGVSSCENTLNTLRYADRVKELGNIGERDGHIQTARMDLDEVNADQDFINEKRDYVKKLKKAVHFGENLLIKQTIVHRHWEELNENVMALSANFQNVLRQQN